MRRIAVVTLLLLGAVLTAHNRSHAQTPTTALASSTTTPAPVPTAQINGFCIYPPYNTVAPCPGQSTGTVTPTPVSIEPTKLLDVSGPTQAPAGTTSYTVTLTSQFVCFGLNEPIDVYALGQGGAAVLTPLVYARATAGGSHVRVTAVQDSGSAAGGTAVLSLEVFNKALGTGGLDVKAVWPAEGVERVVQVVQGEQPTAVVTAAGATSTPVPTATTQAVSPAATDTPVTTATPKPGRLTVNACVQPLVLSGHTRGGDSGTLYGLSTPGAQCVPSIVYSTGYAPSDQAYLAQTLTAQIAGPQGLVAFPWAEDSTGYFGIGKVTCTVAGQAPVSACTVFRINQSGTPPSDAELTAVLRAEGAAIHCPNAASLTLPSV